MHSAKATMAPWGKAISLSRKLTELKTFGCKDKPSWKKKLKMLKKITFSEDSYKPVMFDLENENFIEWFQDYSFRIKLTWRIVQRDLGYSKVQTCLVFHASSTWKILDKCTQYLWNNLNSWFHSKKFLKWYAISAKSIPWKLSTQIIPKILKSLHYCAFLYKFNLIFIHWTIALFGKVI